MPPPPSADELHLTDRTALKRLRERGSHDRALAHDILDEALICHVGFVDDGTPFVVPTTYARIGDWLYLHGAASNHMLRCLAGGAEATVTVTILDGLVLARSAFHHSMNYRSVMLFGRAERVTDPDEERLAASALLEHVAPGRSADARPPSDDELRRTLMVRFPISEGSVKVRTGPPIDDPEDIALGAWAGEVPLHLAAGAPVTDAAVADGTPAPEYARRYPDRRRRSNPG